MFFSKLLRPELILFRVFPIPSRLQALFPKALFFPSWGSVALPLPRGGRGSKSYSCVLIFAGGIKVALIALSPLYSPAVVRTYTLINIGFV